MAENFFLETKGPRMDKAIFPQRLREIRKERGLTQQQLADALGVDRVTVNRWECGEREPNWSTIIDLCSALGVSCEAFGTKPKKGKR